MILNENTGRFGFGKERHERKTIVVIADRTRSSSSLWITQNHWHWIDRVSGTCGLMRPLSRSNIIRPDEESVDNMYYLVNELIEDLSSLSSTFN
jgi:hypothetical protein